MLNNIITIDPEIVSGTPVFSGTRVPVKSLFDYLSTGETIETYLEDFPYVDKSQVLELLKIASKLFISTTETLFHEENFA
ncbi:MAG: DUF433 domain-containing protein [Bacteroidales bacterium]|nr:DUF433 domain-containing protein [Bacteroidales bacterium]